MNKTGYVGNLDDTCFDLCKLGGTKIDVENSRSRYLLVEENGIDQFGCEEENSVIIQFGDTVNPDLVKMPRVSDDWADPPLNNNKGGHRFN